MEEPEALIKIVMDIDHPEPKFLGIADPAASLTTVSAADEEAVEVTPQKKKAKDAKTIDDNGTRRHKNDDKQSDDEGDELDMSELRVLIRAFSRSSLVPIRIVPEVALENANGVPFVDRFVLPAATNVLPATASARATEATGRPQLVTSPLDTGGVTSPSPSPAVTGPLTTVSPITGAPTAVPGTTAPAIGGLTPVGNGSLTPAVTSGLVLANFQPSALDLPRSGSDASLEGDAGLRFGEPNTGVPVNNPMPPAQSLPSTGTGAGVVTEDLPGATLPPIELVPSDSDQAAPVAPIENGVSGTAVFVTTVATIGLLAGAYYSQFRRTGRGPRLRVR